MRIIDADRLKEKMAVTLEVLKFIFPPGENGAHLKAAFSTLGDMVDKCQTIDAVPIVRCKDCKYRDTIDCGMQFYAYDDDENLCRSNDWTRDDGFCYWGERKDV